MNSTLQGIQPQVISRWSNEFDPTGHSTAGHQPLVE
jgi:hypothetical protein